MQPGQIRVFSFRFLAARRLHGFAKRTLRFLLFPIHLQGLFAVAFCESRFSCASDGVLPVKISIGSLCVTVSTRSLRGAWVVSKRHEGPSREIWCLDWWNASGFPVQIRDWPVRRLPF